MIYCGENGYVCFAVWGRFYFAILELLFCSYLKGVFVLVFAYCESAFSCSLGGFDFHFCW